MKGCTALPLGVRGDPKRVEGPGEMRGPAAQTDHPSVCAHAPVVGQNQHFWGMEDGRVIPQGVLVDPLTGSPTIHVHGTGSVT